MMKRFIRKTLVVGTVLAAGGTLTLPAITTAQDLGQRQAAVCSALSERRQVVQDNFDKRTDTYNQARDGQLAAITDSYAKVDTDLATLRARNDLKRVEIYELMDQKPGVNTTQYRQEVDAAIALRRTAYDAARTTFRNNVDALREARHQRIIQATEQLRLGIEAAFDNAETACGSRVPDKGALRTQFVRALEQARLDFAAARNQDGFKDQYQTYIRERNDAFKAARTAFEQTMSNLHVDIKAD